MDPAIMQMVITGAVELLCLPVIVFVIKRVIGKRFDTLDAKKDEERNAQDQEYRENERWRNAMTSGMRSILRAELVREHRKCVKQGYVSLENLEYVQRTYESYHNLGGNDIGTQLYNDILRLHRSGPSEEEKE